MKLRLTLLAIGWIGLWLTPDQQGQRYFHQKKFGAAARTFQNPLWRGVAYYRDGEFEKATEEFARIATPEARFNEGNAWLMLGKYDQAISNYQRALEKRPDWKEAQENQALAASRAKARQQKGGDLGDQKLGADDVVFDQKKTPEGQKTVIAGEQSASEAAVQALWLRRVQTRPADFLKAKFAYQLANPSTEDIQ